MLLFRKEHLRTNTAPLAASRYALLSTHAFLLPAAADSFNVQAMRRLANKIPQWVEAFDKVREIKVSLGLRVLGFGFSVLRSGFKSGLEPLPT